MSLLQVILILSETSWPQVANVAHRKFLLSDLPKVPELRLGQCCRVVVLYSLKNHFSYP